VSTNRFVSLAVVLLLVDATNCRDYCSIGLWRADLQKSKSVLPECPATLKVFSLAYFRSSE
jgi:hypothetical protein